MHRSIHVDGHHARNALLLHGHAYQLLGHFHGDFVVADEQKLGVGTHAADKFGSQCVVVAIDARRRADGSGWNVYKNGGRIDTGLDAIEWAVKANELGAGEILLTSMDCDGTKDGYDIELTRLIADNVSVPVIASGGAGTKEHFYEALTEGKADAALAASLFHYKELEIMDLKKQMQLLYQRVESADLSEGIAAFDPMSNRPPHY